MFTECSAKAGYNIKALFRKLAAALPQSNDQGAGQQGQSQSNTVVTFYCYRIIADCLSR